MKLTAKQARETVLKATSEKKTLSAKTQVKCAKHAALLDQSDLNFFEKVINAAIKKNKVETVLDTVAPTSQNVVNKLRENGFKVTRVIAKTPYSNVLKSVGLNTYRYKIGW